MANLNKVLLMGNLTRDPDLRGTPGGNSVCEFGLAITERYGENEQTVFVDVTAWGKTAEFCKNYLSKGSNVFIDGKLKLDQWEDRNGGGRRSKLSVTALAVQSLSRKSQNDYQEQPAQPAQYNAPPAYNPRPVNRQYAPPPAENCQPFPSGPSDDDMPF